MAGDKLSSNQSPEIVGATAELKRIFRIIPKVASTRNPVLILGETGTGKELVARAIHAHSPLNDKPFVAVDCGALSPFLFETELFGHTRGAFTGAIQARMGLLAAAGRGTVFLDEIAELPLGLQSKFFRALQDHEFRPVGGNVAQYFEARVMAATAQNLEEALRAGLFRKELYYRLNVIRIKLPALRERKDDIPILAHSFLEDHRAMGPEVKEISSEAMGLLMQYDWPGNVRELENCIKHGLVFATGPQIETKDLPHSLLVRVENFNQERTVVPLREMERRAIIRALEATGGNRVCAAKLLGIGKTTLYRKLKDLGTRPHVLSFRTE